MIIEIGDKVRYNWKERTVKTMFDLEGKSYIVLINDKDEVIEVEWKEIYKQNKELD